MKRTTAAAAVGLLRPGRHRRGVEVSVNPAAQTLSLSYRTFRVSAMRYSQGPPDRIEPEIISIESIEVETVEVGPSHRTFVRDSPTSSSSDGQYHSAGGQQRDGAIPGSYGQSHAETTTHPVHGNSSRRGSNMDHSTKKAKGSSSTTTSASIAANSGSTEWWHQDLRNAAYWDIVKVDPFSRSRVTNFVRRAGNASANIFEVREDTMSGVRVFVASCRLSLPEPHRSYVAEGVAENPKDAELLAAMHAERVCDALGVPLFRLPSMQRRHAESARAEGRYAPLPEDPVKPDGTRVPPPLRMVPSLRGGGTGSPEASTKASVPSDPASTPHGGVTTTQTSKEATPSASSPSDTATSSLGSSAATRSAPSSSATAEPSHHTPLFRSVVAEAEVVEPSQPSGSRNNSNDNDEAAANGIGSLFGNTVSSRSDRSGNTDEATLTESTTAVAWQRYRENLWLPWAEPVRPRSANAANVAVSGASAIAGGGGGGGVDSVSGVSAAAVFDPTEGGHWAMVTTASTRCSPTPQDALVLPCVYEPAAADRIKDFYLQQGLDWKAHMAVSSAAVLGSPTRMYVVELRLPCGGTVGGVLSAKGKAQTTEVATHLAAMHAELLLAALGIPLFPADPARQARHARAAAGFGRWAPNPLTGDVVVPAAVQHAPLPRPLKQQIGGDEVWLDPDMMAKANAYSRSDGERMIGAMNELNFFCGDCVEVNPPEEWLEESVEVLRQWQTNLVRNPYPELYVITGMGDFYRATTLTPVPREFGVRGGNAIGRSIPQAVQLCAMHAVDTLCALGIPLYADPAEQERFLWKRKYLGRVTHADMKGMRRPKGLIAVLKPSIVCEPESGDPDETELLTREGCRPTTPAIDPSSASSDDAAALPSSFPLGRNAPERVSSGFTQAYLPGYIMEGNARRLPPHIKDTLSILQLRIPEDFKVCGGGAGNGSSKREETKATAAAAKAPNEIGSSGVAASAASKAGWGTAASSWPAAPSSLSTTAAAAGGSGSTSAAATQPAVELTQAAELLQSIGNDTKTCVQNYLREQHALRKSYGMAPSFLSSDSYFTGHVCPLAPSEEEALRQWLAAYPLNVLPSIYITGYGKQVSVHNIAYLRVPPPIRVVERLRSTGGDAATPGTSLKSKKKKKQQQQQQQQDTPQQLENKTTPQASVPPLDEALPPLLAIGISLKKKDAERACYLHAAALLWHVHGEDVVSKHRAGLPRQGSVASLAEVAAKLLPEGYLTRGEGSPAEAGAAKDLPKPLMSILMRNFMESGRHYTAPRKRTAPGPYNPF